MNYKLHFIRMLAYLKLYIPIIRVKLPKFKPIYVSTVIYVLDGIMEISFTHLSVLRVVSDLVLLCTTID